MRARYVLRTPGGLLALGIALFLVALALGLWGMNMVQRREAMGTRLDWPTYRHDARLSGHRPAKMQVRTPKVRWQVPLGGQVGFVLAREVTSAPGLELLSVEGGAVVCRDREGKVIWRSPNVVARDLIGVYDLDEDGRQEVVATALPADLVILAGADGKLLWRYRAPGAGSAIAYSGVKVGKVVPEERGLQIIVWAPKTNLGRVLSFADGASAGRERVTLDATNPDNDDVQYPIVTLVDVDADGVLEVATPGWGHLFVFDGSTGRQKRVVKWLSGGVHKRNYGHFAWGDIDGDGFPEGVLLADGVVKHFAVIENDGKELSLLWDHLYEAIYELEGDRIEPRPVTNSLADLDGDGEAEIVVGLFNATGDGRWHTLVLEPRLDPKAPVWDLPDRYPWGAEDVDGDGRPELLLSEEPARTAGSLARVSVMALSGGAWQEIWAAPAAHFVEQTHRDFPDAVNSISYHAKEDVWVADVNHDGHNEIFVRQDTDADGAADVFAVWSFVGREPRLLWQKPIAEVGAGVMDIADLDGDGRLELLVQTGDGRVGVVSADGDVLTRFPAGGFGGVTPVVSDLDADGRPEVIVQTARGTVAAFNVSRGRAVARWEVPGYGRALYGLNRSVVAADLNGDGKPEVLIGRTEKDTPVLTALTAEGQPLWRHPFVGFPAGNSSSRGLYEWTVGRWGTDGGVGIYVALARNSLDTQESFALNGVDGRELWHRTKLGHAFGPTGCAAVYDVQNDGVDEIILMAKDFLGVVEGSTAKPYILPRPVDVGPGSGFVAYGSPIIVDPRDDGHPAILLGGNYGGQGLYSFEGLARWWVDAYEFDVMGRMPGVADVDGDGVAEMAVGFADGSLRVYDSESGAKEWDLSVGSVTTDIISADVDGDGRAEFIFGTQDGRLCAAEGDAQRGGHLLWQLALGSELSSPIVADADGDDQAEILVVAGDGVLYAVR